MVLLTPTHGYSVADTKEKSIWESKKHDHDVGYGSITTSNTLSFKADMA